MRRMIRKVLSDSDLVKRIVLLFCIVAAVFMVTLGVALSWLSGHHLVKTDKGLVVINKRFIGLKNSRMDIRGWSWKDAEKYPEVCKAMEASGYADLLPKPPPVPTFSEKAVAMLKEWQESTVEYGSNTWAKVTGTIKDK